MEKDIKTDIIMLLDRSGSMFTCLNDVEGGFNSFIEEQKMEKGETFVTLAQFDDNYEIVYEDLPINDVKPLNLSPRGSTALLDAIGKTITSSKNKIKSKSYNPDIVLFVIITDGHENSSIEYKKDTIKSLISQCEKDLGWKFVYIGANQDAFSEAKSMGVGASGVLSYNSSKGTKSMFQSLSRGTSSYRERAFKTMLSNDGSLSDSAIKSEINSEEFFTEEDKKDQTKFGIDW